MKLDARQHESLRHLLADSSRAPTAAFPIVGLNAGGVPVTPAKRDELLAMARAGQYVELELDVKAYEQQVGVTNRKFVRVADAAFPALAASGVGKPFLRDHEQFNVNARAGTILASKAEKPGAGHYVLRLNAQFTAPWAVDLALRGLLSAVSIGMHPTGPLLCSLCDTPVFEDCWHLPGAEVASEDGPPSIVEWVFTSAELVEASVCSVAAVPTAEIEAIRASLAAPALRQLTLAPASTSVASDDDMWRRIRTRR